MSIPREPAIDDFPYPDDRGQTHSPGCWKWRGHHNCAVARVRELEARLAEATEVIRFYAADENWLRNGPLDGDSTKFTGGPARAFLEGPA